MHTRQMLCHCVTPQSCARTLTGDASQWCAFVVWNIRAMNMLNPTLNQQSDEHNFVEHNYN